MSSNLLSLVQDTMSELNLGSTISVVGNNNKTVVQVFALLKRAGKELIKEFEWQILQKNYQFRTNAILTTGDVTAGSTTILNVANTTGLTVDYSLGPQNTFAQDTNVVSVSGTTVTVSRPSNVDAVGTELNFSQQRYNLPADYECFVPRTHWDRDRRWEMLGPETPQQREWLKSGYISTGPRLRWWIQGNQFQLWPNIIAQGPLNGELLSFEYRSKSSITDVNGMPLNDYVADTDINLLDDTVLVNYTKLKYFRIKGFDTEDLENEFNRYLSIAKANDSGSNAILNFSPTPSEVLIGWQNIPDSGYGI